MINWIERQWAGGLVPVWGRVGGSSWNADVILDQTTGGTPSTKKTLPGDPIHQQEPSQVQICSGWTFLINKSNIQKLNIQWRQKKSRFQDFEKSCKDRRRSWMWSVKTLWPCLDRHQFWPPTTMVGPTYKFFAFLMLLRPCVCILVAVHFWPIDRHFGTKQHYWSLWILIIIVHSLPLVISYLYWHCNVWNLAASLMCCHSANDRPTPLSASGNGR